MFLKDHNKTAIIYNDKEISYTEFMYNIKEYASLYKINKEDRVAIFSEARPEWAYSFYSVWLNNGIVVPIDAMASSDDISYIIDDATPTVIFTSEENEKILNQALSLTNHKPRIICFRDVSITTYFKKSNHSIEKKALFNFAEDDTAVMIYTSGTTGSPKGVMLSFGNLLSNINGVANPKYLGENSYFDSHTLVLTILPLHHILPLQGTILMPFAAGGTVCMLNKISADILFNAMARYKPTILIGVPRLFEMFHTGIMAKIHKSKIAEILFKIARVLNSIKISRLLFKKVTDAFGGGLLYCISGGAKLDKKIAEDFHTLGLMVLEGYGMSETSPIIAYNKKDSYSFGTVGTVMNGVEVKVENSELLVRGPNVMKGYFNRPEETKAMFKDGWLRTGDKAEINKKGFITITGRLKDIIVLPNGKNINPAEIEEKLVHENELISEIGIIEKKGHLFAVIYPNINYVKENNILNLRETIKWNIIDTYNLKVSDYKKILNFEIVNSELPKTRIGKLKRHELPDLLNSSKKVRSVEKIPKIKEYNILVNFLKDITAIDISPSDHIEIDLGLDSLDKIELQERIEKSFGFVLESSDLVEHSTVSELAKFIHLKKTRIEAEEQNWGEILKQKIDFKIPSRYYMLRFLVVITKPFMKFYLRVKAYGLKNVPSNKPVIFAPNHQSFLDGLLISTLLKHKIRRKTFFVADDINFKTWLHRFYARHSNVILLNINKNLKETLQKMATLLKKGKNIVIFPEGARTRNGKMLKFKKTFAILSKELNIDIIPVVIKGAYRSMSIGKKLPRPGRIDVKFLKPIKPVLEDNYMDITSKTRKLIQDNVE